jgi:predicted RNase H-like HicB family nuclease
MQYQILIKQQSNGFLATPLGLPNCEVEAQTKEEALTKAKAAIKELFSEAELITLEVETTKPNPWLQIQGQFKDEPLFDEVLKEIDNYRASLDAKEEI